MANVLDLLKPLAQPSMNGFDLSQKHVYGSAPGRFDAPLFLETMPHDKFKFDMQALMRTMTLNTSAFLRGKVTFDFYFVPYTQLWHPFNQFIDQRLDVHSTLQKGIKFVPVIHLYDLFKLILLVKSNTSSEPHATIAYYLKDIHNVPWYNNIWHMLDFFGFGNFLHIKDFIESAEFSNDGFLELIEPYRNKYVNVFRPAAYQHIWYDYIRNKFFDNYEYEFVPYINDYVKFFNFDDIQCDTFANSVIPIDTSSVSASVNLRIFGLFMQRYVQYKQDLLQSALPSQQFGAVSDVQIDFDGSTTITGAANLQGFTGSDSGRWRNQNDGDLAAAVNVRTAATGNNLVQESDPASQIFHSHSVTGTATIQSGASFVGVGNFDVIALKRAEALQKWRQNALRAGNMVDDSFRAHFGVKPRYEADNNALKLGSFEGTLSINTVETTAISAESGNNKVGDLGASATSVISGSEIQFSCSDFGVIVCTQYFRPESEYSSCMIDRANTLHEPFDFPSPEFCNIGLDSVELRDYNFAIGNSDTILGFASQYWWFKQAFDKCHGEFAKYNAITYTDGSLTPVVVKGDSVMWDAPRIIDMLSQRDGGLSRSKASFYVQPNILEDIFGIAYFTRYATTPAIFYSLQNQLIFNVYFDVKAIRPLTVVGLPNF